MSAVLIKKGYPFTTDIAYFYKRKIEALVSLTKKQILSFLRKNSRAFHEQYNVQRIGLFGSYARMDQRIDSDIDILVEGENVKDDDLKEFLERHFEKKVNVVKENTLYNFMRYIIQKETEYA